MEYERAIIWNDHDLNIRWPIYSNEKIKPIISEKDKKAMTLKEAINTANIFI